MTGDEIPPEWLRAVHDAYRAAFGQRELNLVAPGLPVVIQAVRPLIEAQALAGFTTEWAVQITSRLTGRSEIVTKPNEASARRAWWDEAGRSDQNAALKQRRVGPWTEVPNA